MFAYASCKNDHVDGCDFPQLSRAVPFVNNSVKATPGFFSIELVNGVTAEMTVAQHTSLFRFSFDNSATPYTGSKSPLVFLDLADLSYSRQDNATIAVDAKMGRMTGNGRFLPSFGEDMYVAYFCADFHGSTIRDNGIYVNSRASADVKDLTISRGINGYPLPGGAWVRFTDESPVLARVGLSFISSEQACSLAEAEIPNFGFEQTQAAAVSEWKKKLSPISVSTKGVSEGFLKNFYCKCATMPGRK